MAAWLLPKSSASLLLAGYCLLTLASASFVTLDGNGYKGIVVAIHKDIEEDEDLIKNIKTLFSNASKFLYTSTRQGVYFKEITIIVPSNWSSKPEYEVLHGNFFSNAHVRVDEPNPEYGDAPYTLQPGGCGEPGQYIHLTPWFIKELNGKTAEMFGAPERQLVHEWAHLRYGVFDEYGIPGDKRYPMFYQENGKVRPTSCIRDIKGWIESRDGGPCRMNSYGEVDDDCIFIPNMHSNEAKASIMYMPFIPSMEGFCDDVNHKHSVRAPTKHNAVCNYKSTWEVISSHEDFHHLRTKRDAVSDLTETLFRILQAPKNPSSRYVLVLDISGSMSGRPMKLLHQAATRLVEDRIPDGAYLGIVQFSTKVSVLSSLTKVDNTTRMKLSHSLPSKDDEGRTAIGSGLLEGLNVLKSENSSPEGGLIMLITDGEENVPPFIEDVLPVILESKVIINAVAFGPEASEKLENLTTITGGRGYFFSHLNGSRPSSALDSAFLESITSQADVELQPVQLKDELFNLAEQIMIRPVYVDEELGKNTIFTITSVHLERVADVVLVSPSGKTYNQSSPEYNRDDRVRQRIEITFSEAEPGKWELIFHRRDSTAIIVGVTVTSEPKDIRAQPIRVRSWLNEVQLEFPAYAKVYAEVKKGYSAIIGATVIATVERPMGHSIDLQLRDDGIGADITANDGIYTGYFTHFNGNGRYAVMAKVSNDGQARIKRGIKASGSPRLPRRKGGAHDVPLDEFLPENFLPAFENETTGTEVETDPASNFDRSSNSGAFRLDSWNPDLGDMIPPGNIMDLAVISTNVTKDKEYHVTLQWTTPGDDLEEGQVSTLELRVSKEVEELLTDFESGIVVNESSVINGSLLPEPPGTKQRVTVIVPQVLQRNDSEPWTIYFALRAEDDANNQSLMYNVASATFSIPQKRRDPPKPVPEEIPKLISNDTASSDGAKEESSFNWWWVAVGIGVVVAVAVIAVIILKKTRVKAYFALQKEQC